MGLPVQWLVAGLGIGYLYLNGTFTLRGTAIFGVVAAAGVALLLYKYQENLLFQPKIFPQHLTPKDNPPGFRHPGEHGLAWEDVRLQAADGTKLHAWLIRPESLAARYDRPTVLFCHENAGNMGLRMENLRWMYQQLDVNLMILSYRGYGESEGTPNEEGLYQDAEAALQYLRARTDLDTSRIVLFGRSLGGGVVIDLASKHEGDGSIAGVVVENSFASISDMVNVIFPLLNPFKGLILRMKWESVVKIAGVTRPLLFLSGAQDEIVPASQMVSLHAAAVSSRHKEFVSFENGQHNSTWQQGGERYLDAFRKFLAQHAAAATQTQRRAAHL